MRIHQSKLRHKRLAEAFTRLEPRDYFTASITVLGEGNFSAEITAGSTTTSSTLGTNYGTVGTNLPTNFLFTHTYYIVNQGNAALSVGTVTLGGDTIDFTVQTQPVSTVAVQTTSNPSFTTFTIGFNTNAAPSAHNVVVHIPTNDPNHPDFSYVISATSDINQSFPVNPTLTTAANSTTQYVTTTPGVGRPAVNGDILQMNYTGYLANGSVFDASATGLGTPLGFILGHTNSSSNSFDLIKGWELALVGVKEGETRELYITQDEGYGSSGSGASIAPNASLIFTVTVTKLIGPSFVQNLYHDILGRTGDPSGITSWTNQLAPFSAGLSKPPTILAPADVANSFINSQEYRQNRITALYTQVLGRGADAGGMTYWLNYLGTTGNTVESMQSQFYGSQEFANQHGNTTSGVITGLYEVLLLREPDQAGLDYWSGKVTNGESVSGVAYEIIRAPEGLNTSVTAIYQLYLHRQPDQSGLAYWANILGGTGKSETDVISGIMSSQEYYSA